MTLLEEMTQALLHHSDWDLIGADGDPIKPFDPFPMFVANGYIRVGRDSDAMDAPTYDLNFVSGSAVGPPLLDHHISRFIERAGFGNIAGKIYYNARRGKDLALDDFKGPLAQVALNRGIAICFFGLKAIRHGTAVRTTFEAFAPLQQSHSRHSTFIAGTIYRISVTP